MKHRLLRRWYCLLLAMLMLFGMFGIVDQSVVAYTSHSRNEAVEWAKNQIGSYIDVDGAYGAQCVDLIKAYYQYLGVSAVTGNGCDYSHNSLPSGWTRIQNTASFVPDPGDIVVWTDEGWKNGHVAIFLSGTTSSFTSIDQNWPKGSAVKEVDHNYKYVWGVVRPDFSGKDPILPTTVDNRNYAITATVNASHKINTYNEYGDVESNRWIDSGDKCIIDAIYVNDYVHVQYPTGGSTEPNRWTYAKLSDFTDVLPINNKPQAVWVDVSAGTHYTPTSIWWGNSSNADHYDVKLWNGTYWQGDAYKIVWNVSGTECQVNLPAGYYEGYVDSVNSDGVTMSNVIQFTVGEGEVVDKGDDFYATILRNDTWSPLADIDGNVCINNDSNNIWHFVKQSDGAYTIQNTTTEKYLDLYCSTDENGGNVQTCDYNGSNAQNWFIYGRWSGEYYLKPKCTTNRVLDIDRASENAQVWTLDYNDNQKLAIYVQNKPGSADVSCSEGNKYKPTRIWWNETEDTNMYYLKIYKDKLWEGELTQLSTTGTMCSVNLPTGYYEAYVDSSNDYSYTMSNNVIKFTVTESTPESINSDFYAYIINTPTDAYLIHDDKYNACFSKSDDVEENLKVWHFVRNDDDSFTIHTSVDDGVLDVFDNGDENGSNIDVWGSNGGSNQKWYVQGVSPEYYIKPAYTDRVLDLYGGNYSDNVNAGIWEKNGTDAQKFKIVEVGEPTIKYDLNGGTGTIASQTKKYGQDITLSTTKPARTGYKFIGWNTKKNATSAQYQPGDKYTADKSMTLYAVWDKYEYELSEWKWDGTTSASVNFICKNDSSQNKSVSAKITSRTSEATCEAAGKTVYTATATFDGRSYTDTKEVTIPVSGHNYKLAGWSWSGYNSAVATFTCVNDSRHIQTINATITKTLSDESQMVYTASVVFEGNEYTDTNTDSERDSNTPVDSNTDTEQPSNSDTDSENTNMTGDVNGDGKVNMKDVTRLHQYINGWEVFVNENAIDINGDGKINMKDLTRLHQFINGWNVSIHINSGGDQM